MKILLIISLFLLVVVFWVLTTSLTITDLKDKNIVYGSNNRTLFFIKSLLYWVIILVVSGISFYLGKN